MYQPVLNWDVDSPRVRAMKKNKTKIMPLVDAVIAKMNTIDAKEFQRACEQKDGNYLCGLSAQACSDLKIREKTNKNDGVFVEIMQLVGGGKKGWAWCMYQVEFNVGMAELLSGVKSLFPYSGSCAAARKAAKKTPGLVVDFAKSVFGACWIKVYSNGTGHTGIFKKWISFLKTAVLNEGNTSGGKIGEKVVREGGGSYTTERAKDKSWVMCLVPFPVGTKAPDKGVEPIKIGDSDKVDETVAKDDAIPKFGERSDRVATLQSVLNSKNVKPKLDVDGEFGKLTKANVSKFQKANKLPGSGILGKKTMALLGI